MQSKRSKDISSPMELAARAKSAASKLALLSAEKRQEALNAVADNIEKHSDEIITANKIDLERASQLMVKGEMSKSLAQRLKFDQAKLKDSIEGIRQIAAMPDPLGQKILARELDKNLRLYKISCPIGLLAVIFEARPEAMPQILSLCLKTANALILKGGSEAENSNRSLFRIMQSALLQEGIPEDAFALIETRSDVNEILKADKYVDLIVPRGSNQLVSYIQNNTRIPVLGHADGICHIYVHDDANLALSASVIVDAKTQYPSACNAVETVLLHKNIAQEFLPQLVHALQKKGVELRLDEPSYAALLASSKGKNENAAGFDLSKIRPASQIDWSTEYGDLILAIKQVESLEEAIEHINTFGSKHTEAMLTNDQLAFEAFFRQVNSANIYMNASTRFADGFRYGFGAELGISTSSMHPRGPVGLEGLMSYKYKILGQGQVVADYTGPDARKFTHIDLGLESGI